MGKAVVFLAVAALTVYLILRFASPASAPNPKQNPASVAVTPGGTAPAVLPAPSVRRDDVSAPTVSGSIDPITPPRTAERRAMEQTEAKRASFYALLLENFPYLVAVRPASDDAAVLEVFANVDDARISTEVVRLAVAPEATKYGFEKVRFYLPNSTGTADRFRLAAEANADNRGVWTTYQH